MIEFIVIFIVLGVLGISIVMINSKRRNNTQITGVQDEFTQINHHAQTQEYLLTLYAKAKELSSKEYATHYSLLYQFLVNKLEEIGLSRKHRGGDGGYTYFVSVDMNQLRASDLYKDAYRYVKSEYERKVFEFERQSRTLL